VQSAAEVLEIAHLLDRKPAKLSGGQRQRVAIGRAIVKEPKAFLFDEPLSNLDAALRGRTRLELAQLHRRLGSTMIFVTHDQIEAMTLADRIVVMHNRKIEQVGTPMEIYRRPATRFVAGFVGTPAMSILPVRQAAKTANGLRLDLGPAGTHDCAISVPDAVLAAGNMEMGIRPEDITVGAEGAAGIAAVAEVVERLGERTLVYAVIAGGPNGAPIHITAEADGRSTLKAGQAITLTLNPAAFHLFGGDGTAFHAVEGA
jgi:multiple sugar transport system ATP-binding protein